MVRAAVLSRHVDVPQLAVVLTTDLMTQAQWAMSNRDAALRLLDKADAEEVLRDYIPVVWPVLEPGREFKSGWSIDATCEHLQAVTEGELRKLLINVPPGCMKSLTTCVLWPTWEWGPKDMPWLRYCTSSYSKDLSIRDNRRSRIVIESDVYQELWGDRYHLVGDQNAKQKFETDKRGFRFASSVGGVTTGERGDRFIIDDPHNVMEAESEKVREEALQWFAEATPTRVTDPEKAAYIVIMQRVHERDVSGMIIANELGYEHLMLPMEFEPDRKCYLQIRPKYFPEAEQHEVYYDKDMWAYRRIEDWEAPDGDPDAQPPETETRWEGDPRHEEDELLWPERFTRRHLEDDLKPQMRSWGGSYAEAGQLQQRPSPRGGGMFQRKDFQYIDLEELATLHGRRVRGYDLAASDGSDSSATAGCLGFIDQHDRVIIVDVVSYHKMAGGVKSSIKSTAEADGLAVQIDLPQDPGQAGKAQKADLAKHLHGYDVTFGLESGDKVKRATPLSAQCEAQNVYLVRGPWNEPFIKEAIVFPNGTLKDQIDAASRMYANLVRKKPQRTGFGPKLYAVN